jgi:hypothetical protein
MGKYKIGIDLHEGDKIELSLVTKGHHEVFYFELPT